MDRSLPEENPFEPSQVSAAEGADSRPPRRTSLLFVIPLVTLASVVAFCGSCIPISIFTINLIYPSASTVGNFIFFGGWFVAGVIGVYVGWKVWRSLQRPREESE